VITPSLSVSLAALQEVEFRAQIPFWDKFTQGYEAFPELFGDWDVCELGGEALPGLASIKGSAMQRIDVQKVNGQDGGALVERGYTPGKFDIDLVMWMPQHWAAWQPLLLKIYRRAGKLDVSESADDIKKKSATKQTAEIEATSKNALAISHPATRMLGVHAVIVESVALPVEGPVPGSKLVTIKCVQYVAPSILPAVRKVKGTVDPGRLNSNNQNPTRAQGWKPSVTDGDPNGTLWPRQGTR
jgi:hypothetical protein